MPTYQIKGKSLLGSIFNLSPESEMRYGISGLMPAQLPAVPVGVELSPTEIALYDNIFRPKTTEDLLRLIAQDRVRNAAITNNKEMINSLVEKVRDYPAIIDYIKDLIGGK